MKEYLMMLLVFMATILVLGWFFGSLIIAWVIVGRATLYQKGVILGNDGLASYWFYFAWPIYLAKFKRV